MTLENLTLKQRRVMNGYTQQYVADKIKVHVNTYRRIERNPTSANVKVDTALELAELYGVQIGAIFFAPITI